MFKLVKAHFHKDKAVLTAFLVILVVAVTLLHTGLMVARFDAMYDDKTEEQNVPDAMYFILGNEEEINKQLSENDKVESSYLVDIIFPDTVTLSVNSGKEKDVEGLFFVDKENEAVYQDLNYVEKDDSITGPSISVNVYTAYSEGLRVGDKVKISHKDLGSYDLTVSGIYEDLFCGQRYSYYSSVIDHETYGKIAGKAEKAFSGNGMPFSMQFLCASFIDGADIDTSTTSVQDGLIKAGIYCNGYNKMLAKAGYTGITNVIAAFMASFSAIIMVIAFIMIVFTVNTNINRDIANIGALRAVGFTISQVRRSLMIEYSIVAAVACILGISASYLLFPVLEEYAIKQLSGLVWDGGFRPEMSFPVFAGIVIVMLVVTFAATHLIRNIHPATALRFGLESHSFKKNYLPLDRTSGRLDILLALKSTLQSRGQNLIIAGVILAVSYMTAFSAILFYNTRIDITKFQRLLQGDAPDAYVNIKYESEEEMYDCIEKIRAMEGVTEAYGLGSTDAHTGDYNCYLLYSDMPQNVYCGVYEGEMAVLENEAVVGGVLAEKQGLGIGDEIKIKYMDKEESFLITGLQQAVYGFGERIYISDEGFRRLGGEPVYTYIRVRIENPSDASVGEFLERAEALLGDNCTSTENYYHTQRSTDNVPVFAVALVILVLIVLNIFTVAIVIRLLLKTVFIKREKEFGIKKAVGFTSRQLRVQLALSLLPVSIIGSVLGAITACLTTNRLFDLIFNSYGIKNSDLTVNPVVVPVTLLIVILMVFVISFVMSGRMKKISAYQLISE
jgi:ABC-type antimicrobial peptide transport system permease subunit